MKAFFIPGALEDISDRNYQAVLDIYKTRGYEPVFVNIDWKYKTIDDWVNQIKGQIPESELQKSLLSGFSWGAMIALRVAADINPKKLVLFSLSPYFVEDFPLPKSYENFAGKKRMKTYRNLSFNELAQKIDCPTLIFAGTKEGKDVDHRTNEAAKRIKNIKKTFVTDCGHDVADPMYLEAIQSSNI